MTVKSATKKKLQDLGVQENYAHELADDRKWDDVKLLTPVEIAKICGTDSKSGEQIHNIIQSAGKGKKVAAAQTFSVKRKRRGRRLNQLEVFNSMMRSKKWYKSKEISSKLVMIHFLHKLSRLPKKRNYIFLLE